MSDAVLERLRARNDLPVYPVTDPRFRSYGRVLAGYDFTPWLDYMTAHTHIPAEGNRYVPSEAGLEECALFPLLRDAVYGGMPIQAGYCNGRNSTYNGFEYHKGSELNIAVTGFALALGHSWDITDGTYDVSQAELFYVPAGTAVEMYQTTLHLSPLRVREEGYMDIVVLPRGTNTPLPEKPVPAEGDPEGRLLLQRNKWVIAHPERHQLTSQGAWPGVTGPNRELLF